MKYQGLSFEDFSPADALQEAAMMSCVKFVSELPETQKPGTPTAGRGLALMGPHGTGKTLMAALTAMDVHRECRVNIQFIRAVDYMRDFGKNWSWQHSSDPYFQQKAVNFDLFQKRIESVKFLIFDDIAAVPFSTGESTVSEIERITRQRCHWGLPSMVTCDGNYDDLEKKFGTRMRSFFLEAFQSVIVTGDDQRAGR